ncbi:surface antigen [Cystoisospora suis]|uniref:Surface antigen n=1 Tax=Cystoisospora suis TaxID=483139 RepID=A0A2C6KZF7_9APIC|nr:surface antigen [Cystoisospora suis]
MVTGLHSARAFYSMWSCFRAASAAIGFALCMYAAAAVEKVPGYRRELGFIGNRIRCPAEASTLLRTTVTLHPVTRHSVVLECGATASVVPSTLSTGPDVCDWKTLSLAECVGPSGAAQNTVRSLTSLIPSSEKGWLTFSEGAYTFTVPENQFPLEVTKFKIGCKAPNTDTGCLVSVVVQARPTEVTMDELLCSYGQSVTVAADVTKKNPSFSLSCGGPSYFIHPLDYSSKYCDGASVVNCPTKDFNSLFPSYQQSWWKAVADKFVFTVPSDMFPDEVKTFVVGCSPDKVLTDKSTVCSVGITVSSQGTGLRLSVAGAVMVILANLSSTFLGQAVVCL